MNTRVKDMSGKRFSSLIAIRMVGRATSGDLKWEFLCDCGVRFVANGYYARCGRITTCPKCSAERIRVASVIHGMSESPEFSTWTDMLSRCYNPRATGYRDYGGRGIVLCDRWKTDFTAFVADMGLKPGPEYSIEREDVDGNYEPLNCRWATMEEQAQNKRNTVRIEIDGVTKRLQEWAADSGILPTTIHLRLASGKTGRALLAPSTRGGGIHFNGVRDTYAGWAKRLGVAQSTIYMRLNQYGWSIERALTTGVSK